MDASEMLLRNALEQSLAFEYLDGGEHRRQAPLSLGWVTEPYAVVGQVLSGGMCLECEDRAPLRIAPGGGYAIPPGLRNRAVVQKRGAVTFRWAHINFWILGSVNLFSLLEMPVAFAPEDGARIGAMNMELLRLSQAGDPLSLATLARRKEIGFRFLSLLLEQACPRSGQGDFFPRATRLIPILEYVRKNYGGKITREGLARMAHLSPTRFHAVFKDALGMAPLEYVQQFRLRKAQHLLIQTDLPVAEVGAETGYPDQFHFSRLFKAACGLNPSAYRRRGRQWQQRFLHA